MRIHKPYAYVFIGGLIGSLLRYVIFLWVDTIRLGYTNCNYFNSIVLYHLPLATLLVNLLGSFFLGLASVVLINKLKPNTYSLLTSGLIGSFTTFSTFTKDLFQLVSGRYLAIALIYLITSLLGGLILAMLANNLGRRLVNVKSNNDRLWR